MENIESILIFLAIGAVAGWLAGTLLKGGGLGLVLNIVVGIVGSILGGYVLGLSGVFGSALIGSIVTSTIGAILLLLMIGLIKK